MCATTETPSKYEPTLSGLPKQLKERVLQHLSTVFDDDEEDDEHSHADHDHEHDHSGHSHGPDEACGAEEEDDGCGCGHDHGGEDFSSEEKAQREYKSALSALSRVNKEWFALVAPVFWKVRLFFLPFLSFPPPVLPPSFPSGLSPHLLSVVRFSPCASFFSAHFLPPLFPNS
jgi:hypothetical protein